MKVITHFLKPETGPNVLTLSEFADRYNLTLHIRERDEAYRRDGLAGRFYASFDDVEAKVGNMLVGTYGDGDTPEEAVADYANKLGGKVLVIGAYTSNRSLIGPLNITFDGVLE